MSAAALPAPSLASLPPRPARLALPSSLLSARRRRAELGFRAPRAQPYMAVAAGLCPSRKARRQAALT